MPNQKRRIALVIDRLIAIGAIHLIAIAISEISRHPPSVSATVVTLKNATNWCIVVNMEEGRSIFTPDMNSLFLGVTRKKNSVFKRGHIGIAGIKNWWGLMKETSSAIRFPGR